MLCALPLFVGAPRAVFLFDLPRLLFNTFTTTRESEKFSGVTDGSAAIAEGMSHDGKHTPKKAARGRQAR